MHAALVTKLPKASVGRERWRWGSNRAARVKRSPASLPPVPRHVGAQNTSLHALIDSCHSGTALNLPYNMLGSRGVFKGWEEEYPGRSWEYVSWGAGGARV